jgi:hypothetical protein
MEVYCCVACVVWLEQYKWIKKPVVVSVEPVEPHSRFDRLNANGIILVCIRCIPFTLSGEP